MRGLVSLGGLLIAALGLARPRPVPVPPPPPASAAPEEPAALELPASAEGEAPPVSVEGVVVPRSPATHYVSLTGEACLAELDARHVEYVRVDRPDIDTPVRLAGLLSGVRFRTLVRGPERSRSLYEICDCRLVLALDDFARILRRHDIVDVMHYSAFRPLVPGVVKRGHERALAIDIAFFGRVDGSAYSVLRDFTPIAGEHPCTPQIRAKGPREMRDVVCEAVTQGLFHVALTPDYDRAHRDHFHLELVPGEVRSFAQ